MCSSALRPSSRFVSPSAGIGEYLLEVAKERRTWDSALHQYAAPIRRVLLSTHKVEFREAIQCTSNRRLRYVELGGQPTKKPPQRLGADIRHRPQGNSSLNRIQPFIVRSGSN